MAKDADREPHTTRMLEVPDDLDSNDTSSATKPERPSRLANRDAAVFESQSVGLEALNGPSQGRIYPLHRKQLFVIGRAPGLDCTVPDQAVSRRHCQLTWVRDRLWMEDLASSNGTILNGEIVERVALQDGDVLQVGETELLVAVLPANHPALAEGDRPVHEASPELTRIIEDVDPAPNLEQVLSGVRTALRDVERALIEAFRNTNEAERIVKVWVRTLRESDRRSDDATRARDRLDDELKRTQLQVRGLERLLDGDRLGVSEEMTALRAELAAKSETVDEASERIRALEREIGSHQVELDRQRRALAIAQAALDDERRAKRS